MKAGADTVPYRRLAEELFQLGELFFEHLRGRGLEVEPEQWLSVALTDVEPPVLQLDGDPVKVVDLPLLVDVRDLADLPVLVLDLEVDLAALAVPLQGLD